MLQSVEVDGGEAGVGVGAGLEAALAEAVDEVLGGREDLGIDGEQRGLAVEDVAGGGGNLAPERLGDGVGGAEVEQGLLADGRAVAFGLDETHAAGRPASLGMRLGGAEEHYLITITQVGAGCQWEMAPGAISWHYKAH